MNVDSTSSLVDLACFKQQTDVLFRHAAFSIRNDGFGLGHVFGVDSGDKYEYMSDEFILRTNIP